MVWAWLGVGWGWVPRERRPSCQSVDPNEGRTLANFVSSFFAVKARGAGLRSSISRMWAPTATQSSSGRPARSTWRVPWTLGCRRRTFSKVSLLPARSFCGRSSRVVWRACVCGQPGVLPAWACTDAGRGRRTWWLRRASHPSAWRVRASSCPLALAGDAVWGLGRVARRTLACVGGRRRLGGGLRWAAPGARLARVCRRRRFRAR